MFTAPTVSTFRAMILVAAYTGVRPGELFALTWDDIDFERQEIRVRQSRDAAGQLKLPKSGKARTIVLPPPARDALAQVSRHLHSPFIFHSKSGLPFRSKATFFYAWQPVRAAAGRPGVALPEPTGA